MSIEQIEKKINELKKELEECEGTKTEVYTRIVGYYRATDNWNLGKKAEYKDRKIFKQNHVNVEKKIQNLKSSTSPSINIIPDKYLLFTSPICRNCPPMKEYVKTIDIMGIDIDISTQDGFEIAKKYEVQSTPCLLLFSNSNIIAKTHSVDEIKKVLSSSNKV